jgi:hypothetical protein
MALFNVMCNVMSSILMSQLCLLYNVYGVIINEISIVMSAYQCQWNENSNENVMIFNVISIKIMAIMA